MRISTAQMYRTGVADMLDQQEKLLTTESQLASGEQLLAPSDDPVAALRILEFDRQLASLDQYQRNIDSATSSLQLEDAALESVGDSLQRIRELTVQSLNDSQDATQREAIAVEIEQQRDTLLQTANMKNFNGDYLFSGNQAQTIPFTETAPGVVEYRGDQGQRQIQIGASAQVAAGDPGSDIFTGIPTSAGSRASLFDIVSGLANDLRNDQPDPRSLDDLDAALDEVLDARAAVGGRLNRLDAQTAANESTSLVLEQSRSLLADLDYAEASTRFAQESTALEAAQSAFVKVQSLSLFKYL